MPVIARLSLGFLVLILAACAAPPTSTPVIVSATPTLAVTRVAPSTPAVNRGNVLEQIPACPTDITTPLFNAMPLDPDEFSAFRPLGWLAPPIHVFPAKHSSFAMTLPGQTPSPKPIRAPGKVWVVEVWAATFSTGGANYQIYFYPCREFRAYFYHIASISAKLASEFNKVAPRCNSFNDGTATVTTCRREQMLIPLEPGEVIGTGPDTAGVDFGAVDLRVPPAAFANLDHYGRDYPYYVSPVNYFAPEVKARFESKLGSVFGNKPRTAEPQAGAYMQDIPGTAQGNWFFPGINYRDNTDISSALALVHDYIDPAQPIFSIGNSIKNVKLGLYSFVPQATGKINRDFSTITPDNTIYCFDQFTQGQSAGGVGLGRIDGILLLALPPAATLKIEKQGTTASTCANSQPWAFTASATAFER